MKSKVTNYLRQIYPYLVARTFGSLDCKVDTQVATAADSDAQEMRPIQTIDALAGRPLS